MKYLFTMANRIAMGICFFILSPNAFGQQATENSSLVVHLDTAIIPKLRDAVDCSKEKMVMDKSFNKLTSSALTRVAPNVVGQIKQGTGATLKISDDKTSAEVQGSFSIKERMILTVGFNGAINENVSDIYTGSDGVAKDWGVKANLSFPFSKGLTYKNENECYLLHIKRNRYLYSLREQFAYNLKTSKENLKKEIDTLKSSIQSYKQENLNTEEIKKMLDKESRLDSLLKNWEWYSDTFNEKNTDKKQLKDLLEAVEDSLVAFEVKNARWTGHNLWLFNVGAFYSNKEFLQFNPSPKMYSDRFQDTTFSGFGINVGVSWYHSGPKTNQNILFDISLQRKSNFDLAENSKYKMTYTMDTLFDSGVANVSQKQSSSKKAFDIGRLPFKSFSSFDINTQYTIFLGSSKAFGLNTAARVSLSGAYKPKAEFLTGPVVSIPNADKEGSKLNFALMLGFRDLANKEITTKQKRTVSFYINVPFNIISFN